MNARQKGKSGEYEVIQLLQDVIDDVFAEFRVVAPTLRRNAMAYADGGEDIVGLPWYAFEVKRVEKRDVPSWWAQCLEQAGRKRQDWSEARLWKLMPDYFTSRRMPEPPVPEVYIQQLVTELLSEIVPKTRPTEDMAPVQGEVLVRPGILARVPILLYRQNRQPWSVVTYGHLTAWSLPTKAPYRVRTITEVDLRPWLQWFRLDLRARLLPIFPNPPATPG